MTTTPIQTDRVRGGVLAITLCPACGSFQLTLPLNERRRVSVLIDHDDFLQMLSMTMSLIERYREGTLSNAGFYPIKCCTAQEHPVAH